MVVYVIQNIEIILSKEVKSAEQALMSHRPVHLLAFQEKIEKNISLRIMNSTMLAKLVQPLKRG